MLHRMLRNVQHPHPRKIFGDEVNLIWHKGVKLNQIAFLVLRYGTQALMFLTVLYFVPITEHTTVEAPGGLACPAAMVLIILCVQVLLQVRVYAMYNRSRVNLTLFALEFAVTVYLVMYLSKLIRTFAFECYLMFLKTCRSRASYLPLGSTSVIDILIRGSVQYFALVALGMAISMILFAVAPEFALWVDSLSDATGSIGGTRLILSVRKALLDPGALSVAHATQTAVQVDGDHAPTISDDATPA
ncbi:hypothetical protein AURDEDRAFT_164209 [Auricularia subglabra TFB-10046 SS5]|nr:hypothetical protein AURDEDRAFT_164209 [Auricularia subglabra TFB-10046 SS5]